MRVLSSFFLRVVLATCWVSRLLRRFSWACTAAAIKVRKWELKGEPPTLLDQVGFAVRSVPHVIWDKEEPLLPGDETGAIDRAQWEEEIKMIAAAEVYGSGLKWDEDAEKRWRGIVNEDNPDCV